ncbi:MAG: hypothetical protein LBT38_01590 [Deltaproteobacteria bacterium]|jgi:hypothetical protein|nr:hypothetical protein [Deltaproteobacteria bacterium]
MNSRRHHKESPKVLIAVAILILAITSSSSAFAQNSSVETTPSESERSLGAVVVTQQKIYRGIDRDY